MAEMCGHSDDGFGFSEQSSLTKGKFLDEQWGRILDLKM
jgi:hypothetical protein